ncbi:MAG: methyltransferase domain-containing protein [Anaerolineales bacterium]|jgi:ubiquinone/menaquinone biosynthesis C-methylase UbiE
MRVVRAFLRFFFKHLYTTFAWAYDFVAAMASLGQWGNWQKVGLAALPAHGVTLEIGHGPGHLLLQRMQSGHLIVGVDNSKQMARMAARRLRRAGYGTVNARSLVQALPFADQTFSAALATFPSDFIFQSAALSEIWRVLRPGGSVVVVLGAQITGSAIFERLLAWVYQITFEAIEPEQRWAQPFLDHGFAAHVEQIQQSHAVVVRIVGVKPVESDGLRQ